jgi:hypothetical protein
MTAQALEGSDRSRAGAATAHYVYGVVASSASSAVRAEGVGGARVEPLPFRNVAALVSEVAVPIRAKRRELMSHAEVLNELAEEDTVLPLRFGTTFPDAETVVADFLEPRHDELVGLLQRFHDRVELLVKAYYREEAILAEIVREEPRIARLRAATSGRPAAAAHADRIELGTAVARALEARTAADGAAILDTLRPFAHDVHVDDTPIEHQVLKASVLVARRDVPKVDRALEGLAERNAGRIQFKYVGPLAPHSFVALEGR